MVLSYYIGNLAKLVITICQSSVCLAVGGIVPVSEYQSDAKEVLVAFIADSDLQAQELSELGLEDERLHRQYLDLFGVYRAVDIKYEQLPQSIVPVVRDIHRRGEAVGPVLLKLMEESENTLFEAGVLSSVDVFTEIDLDPFVLYARKALDERLDDLRVEVGECIAFLLVKHGDATDLVRLTDAVSKRPDLAYVVQGQLRKRGQKVVKGSIEDNETSFRGVDRVDLESDERHSGNQHRRRSNEGALWVVGGAGGLCFGVWWFLWRRRKTKT